MAPERKRKKIAILTVPFGGGHLTAAKIIHEALRDTAKGEVTVHTIDMAEATMPLGQNLALRGYEQSVKNLGAAPYKLFYNFADAQPKLVDELFTLLFQRASNKVIKREKPDLIVSTFPIISYVMHRALKKAGQNIPIVSVITDAGDVHRLWLMGVEDTVITATQDTIEYAVSHGVPREKLHYFGFPVLRSFSRLPSRARARAELGLKDAPTVLITSGGLGLNPRRMIDLVEELARRKFPYQVEVVCGKNEDLYEEVLKVSDGRPQVRVHKFVTTMPLLLAAADVVCCKAGWLTVSETIEARRPMILFNIVPGQEEPNAQYVVKSGFGEVIEQPGAIADRLEALLGNPPLLRGYEAVLKKRVSGREAAGQIAKFILEQL